MENIAQTFQVRVAEKTQAHPFFGQGSSFGYVIDGISGGTLELSVGNTYRFDIDTPGHPFYLTTDPVGGAGAPGSLMGGKAPIDKGIFVFTVPNDFPSSAYYQCAVHQSMGGRVKLINHFIRPGEPGYEEPSGRTEIIMLPTLPLAEERLANILDTAYIHDVCLSAKCSGSSSM